MSLPRSCNAGAWSQGFLHTKKALYKQPHSKPPVPHFIGIRRCAVFSGKHNFIFESCLLFLKILYLLSLCLYKERDCCRLTSLLRNKNTRSFLQASSVSSDLICWIRILCFPPNMLARMEQEPCGVAITGLGRFKMESECPTLQAPFGKQPLARKQMVFSCLEIMGLLSFC